MHHKRFLHVHTRYTRIIPLCALLVLFLTLPPSLRAQENGSAQTARPAAEAVDEKDSAESPDMAAIQSEQADAAAPDAASPGEAVPGDTPDYEYEDPDFSENRVSYPMMILRTVAVMGVIIIGVYFLFRVLVKKKSKLVTDSEIISVLATYPLAANRIIQVVDIGGQVLVLGVSDSSINLITELQDKEVIDRIRLASSKEQGGTGTFKDTFMNLLGGKGFSKPGQISHLSGYKKRINRMRKL